MTRSSIALACVYLLAAALVPTAAPAKDTPISVELDGRPLDLQASSAILHRGKAFINVVRVTKGFNGLLTFGKGDSSVRVTIGRKTAQFVIGSSTGTLNGQPTTFPAAPFNLNGDTFVPLAAIAQLAGATLTVDQKHHLARLTSAPVPAAT